MVETSLNLIDSGEGRNERGRGAGGNGAETRERGNRTARGPECVIMMLNLGVMSLAHYSAPHTSTQRSPTRKQVSVSSQLSKV